MPGLIRRSGARVALSLSLCFLASPAKIAAEQQPAAPPFGERIEVRAVEVPVVVTDLKGRPISGLTREDFLLRVDGEETIIEGWRETPTGGEPGTPTEPLKLLVFLDDYFTMLRDRALLLERLAADVAALAPGDEVAVVRFAGVHPEVVSDWTSSHEQVERALRGILERPPGSNLRVARLPPGNNYSSLFRSVLEETLRTTDAAASALHRLDTTGSRKTLLVASPGWRYEYRGMAVEMRHVSDRYGGTGILTPLTDAANLLGWTIHALESDSGHTSNPEGAQQRSATRSDSRLPVSAIIAEARAIRWDSLSFLARATGGRVLARAPLHPHPLLEVARDTGGRYLLAFTARLTEEGARHRLQVEVRRPGAVVRHKSEYREIPASQLALLRARAALLTSGREILRAAFGEARPAGRGIVAVPLRLEVEADALAGVPNQNVHPRLELRVLAVNERGDRSDMEPVPVTLEPASHGEGPPEHFVVETTLLLRQLHHQLTISLCDPELGILVTTQTEFSPR